MKYRTAIFILCVFFTFAGCSPSQVAKPVEATIAPPAKTSTATLAPTPSHTPAPTLTLMPSATVFVSPTATPKNFVLAEKGYDNADVRYIYQKEDILAIQPTGAKLYTPYEKLFDAQQSWHDEMRYYK